MSRVFPTRTQLEKLMSYMESRPWLARGWARTAHARERNRKAWTEIAAILNKEKKGSTKSPDQWGKYWKDKKASIKRKFNLLAISGPRADGNDELDLSTSDLKILMLMGLRGFASGDQHIPRDPLPEAVTADNIEQNFEESESSMREQNEDIIQNCVQIDIVPKIEANWDENQPATETHDSPEMDFDTNRSVSSHEEQPETHQANQQTSKESFPTYYRVVRDKFHRRYETQPLPELPRLRLLRGSLPFQRRSQLSLTERLIAVEERRVQAELIAARAQECNARAQEVMAQAVNRMADAFIGVAESVQSLVHHQISRN